MFNLDPSQNPKLREIYHTTEVLRRPISGIVSGYHELPYVFIAPDDDNPDNTLEITGKINVSPKFIITPEQLGETFGDIFEPGSFEQDIQGRMFSFGFSRKKNLKVESERFSIQQYDEKPRERLDRIQDDLMMREDVRTGLVFGPQFKYYPVSLDRFISEIIEREFNA